MKTPMKIAIIVMMGISLEVSAQDLISAGSNSWIFHTPDDGRKNLYLAPRKSDNTDWNWSKNTIFYETGKVTFKNNISVNGKIESTEIKVTTSPTADFVFEEDYDLPTLKSIEKHIKEKRHLPEIASAKEMEKNGVNVGYFQIQLLQKIEELTLYTIEQEKKLKTQEDKINALEKHNSKIETQQKEIDELKALVQELLKDKN